MKSKPGPKVIQKHGVSATIYTVTQTKGEKVYTSYRVAYTLLGKPTSKSFSEMSEAVDHAEDACKRIAEGEQRGLELNNRDGNTYLRAVDYLAGTGIALDVAALKYAEIFKALEGRNITPIECVRDWLNRNTVDLKRITVPDAAKELLAHVEADGKSQRRKQQLSSALTPFATAFNCDVSTLTPALVSKYLSGLKLKGGKLAKERTKRNHRDALGYFFRWLLTREYLTKGTDLLNGVQNYSARKIGEIEIYTPQEIAKLLSHADKRLIPFLAIGAFAGLRHAEIARLDWSEIDFDDDAERPEPGIEVKASKSKNQTRRIVTMTANLRAWLEPHRKDSGKVCSFVNITKQLLWLADESGVKWKHNALRHSAISYRIAECEDVARVAYQSDNSPSVIEQHYLKVVKQKQAAAWFNITPENVKKVATGEPVPTVEKVVSLQAAA